MCPLPTDEIKMIATLENMLLVQRCGLLSQLSGEENLDGCFLGDQGLLLRQRGDMSHLQDVLCRWSSHLLWVNVSRSPPTPNSEHLLIF